MLRRVPTLKSGEAVDRLQESSRVNKPFKPPTSSINHTRDQPARKRKRVSYKGQDAADSDSGDDKKSKRSKNSSKDKDGVWHNEEELLALLKKYPVYKPKPFQQQRNFAIPSMTNRDGEIVHLVPSNLSLGIRPLTKLIPRPLHDPMEDHAIVLYDPTIDDRETDEERREREKQEAKEKAEAEARQKHAGMYNPHKSLKSLLGEDKAKQKVDKVPVVIDPKLTKVLRPHQIEGVKFLYKCTTGMLVDNQYGCIMADEMGLGKTLQCIALLWTLLKQSPHPSRSTVDKCIIACPSSLVKNWANEFVKWLGKDAINAFAVDGKGSKGELLEKVARWVAATGRNISQPGLYPSISCRKVLTESSVQ
jgi:DNA repair and recombination RAD54-like protein